MIFHQLFEQQTSTYTYLLGCEKTREAVLIDPVLETVDRDLKLIEELGLKLVYVLDTHVHADHVTAAGEIRKRLGVKTVVSAKSQVDCADLSLAHGERLKFGEIEVIALHTPGHTDSCASYLVGDRVFTGDALLIRGCGRTDFQQGSSSKLFDSVRQNLFTLPPETLVYPAHDYKGLSSSTIGTEMRCNPRLGMSKSKEDFVKIMSELKLADPKNMAAAVPANMACGQKP
jgi:sulfur dioxygenase